MFAYLILSLSLFAPACGKRRADVRRDFNWDKQGAMTLGY